MINFGILPLTFVNPDDYNMVEKGAGVIIPNLRTSIEKGEETITVQIGDAKVSARLDISERHRQILLADSLLNWAKGS